MALGMTALYTDLNLLAARVQSLEGMVAGGNNDGQEEEEAEGELGNRD